MILTVGNTKGGVGKSTLAVNIAIVLSKQGKDVLLIDGDDQGTSMTFTELRNTELGNAGYTAVSLLGGAIRTQVRQLSPKYNDIVIDVGGRDTGSLRAALTITDTLMIPVTPRSFDIWAIDHISELVKEAREINSAMRAVVFLNCADAQGSDNTQAFEALADYQELEVIDVTIGRRKAFPNAAAAGKSVIEQLPKDKKAVDELNALMKRLYIKKI